MDEEKNILAITDYFPEHLIEFLKQENSSDLFISLIGHISGLETVVGVGRVILDIPTKYYLRKYEKLCKGLISDVKSIDVDNWIKWIGKAKAKHETYALLDILSRIEEDEKIEFFTKVFKEFIQGHLSQQEYRRLIVYINRTMYEELEYMRANITREPVSFNSELEDLIVNGWLILSSASRQKIHKDSSNLYVYADISFKFCDIVK